MKNRNRKIKYSTLSIAALVSSFAQFAIADDCPVPTGSIDPKIETRVNFDSAQSLYVYEYTVSNGAESPLPLNRFRILFSEKPETVINPNRWNEGYWDRKDPGTVTWSTSEGDWLTHKGVQIWPSPFMIFPGKSMLGFVVKSKHPPGTVRFVASGLMTTIPKADPDPRGLDDEPTPNCPGMDFYNTVPYGNAVSGTTIGPVKPDEVISLRLKVKPPKKSGEHERYNDNDMGPIFDELVVNPEKDKGLLRAELSGDRRLSSEDFDISKIDVASIVLGLGKAPAINSKVAGNKLKAEFDLARVSIRCDLDQALFLSGKTKDGKDIQASVRLKKILCKHTREAQRIDLTPKPKKPEALKKR
ncbi:MAG: hypothetical protein A2X94_11735 [Bdellovibrionales bacterium GWB1_55_8]|nr:MAG: hypothetical protein A2X94_11735 [Bdellovibrionales bacterium GWB1_55_8]